MKTLCGRILSVGVATFVVAIFTACSTPTCGEAIDIDSGESDVPHSRVSSSSVKSSSSEADSNETDSTDVSSALKELNSLVSLVDVPSTKLDRGSIEFRVSPFSISKTEVTQSLYKLVVGSVPEMEKVGDSIAVANVNWYDAVLFCNALSKRVGLDTAYIYEDVESSGYLKNVKIDYGVKAVRLPTETEWEIACRAGTSTTYYWNTDPAAKYAYYIQDNGPTKVGQFLPNEYGLYDMGGNVAEWVNDWYDTYPTKPTENYSGPNKGAYRVIRGGGWSDKATILASGNREKKDPQYQRETVGFRISIVR